ncbi:putative filamentation protein Rhf1 [Trichoderma virens Gv29-8]|uniref:Filamentation protein Rhf1 n=1 Tax=Hypocrea virens (strain Gv29-8 / FGSC 10586) TaxID=413071 RepID=G9ND31_HYPVG|nr:putative filamentation protein Rhf1 [Trichoderma virens Gv29-8]EHK15600.1 putative filamentation protein Rhf1 [Trichoderma virens Gv29-8]
MTKAARYADLLDDARCEGNWPDVPELVRKVRKHDPARECLTLTAETECAISKVTAAGTQPTDLDVPNRLPKLMAVVEAETRPEERFQAQVCVGWLHWVVGEYSLALERLPKSLNEQYPDIDPANTASEWTSVCALKAAYLRANILMRDGQRLAALAALQEGLPSLDRVWCGHGIRKQLRYWSELFLTEHCMLTSEALHNSEISLDDPNSISSFRSWAKYWKIMSAPVAGGFGFKGSVPRRRIWNEYYLALSRILENDLPYPTGQAEKMVEDMSARSQLRVEVQRAEAAYQALLLGETAFPRADEERAEIETFVKQVMMNWSILCGRGWSEQDLGQGGRDLLSRTVLDTLYSAATRTYHSTAILRSLFNVHLSVAEFDLAFKALDSYLDILKKGKARVEKTGHPEPSLDDDKTALETMSQGIMILCSYGHQEAAEKARHLGAELEDWLSKLPHVNGQENGTPAIAEDKEESEVHSNAPPPQTVALAWQAIGLAHAHWSRMTTEAGSRAEIQSKAIRCLRRSLAPEFGRSKDVRSFFSLGLLLAERRELATAIELVRSALIAVHGFEEDYNLFYGPYWQERSLIPLWHLLALLLSARQDYVMAARACEGALEQFKDPTVVFGKSDGGFRSEHLNDAEAKAAPPRGLVDDMSDEEKVGILDVKMTQIALVELMEGPDVAVNASFELLTLFSRLFGNIGVQQQALKPPALAEPPKTSRTFKGSIFGSRADRSRPPTRQISNATLGEKSTVSARPATSHTTAASIAPAVQVTSENGDGRSRSGSLGAQTQRSESGRRNSLKKKTRSGSQRRRSSSAGGLSHQATVVGDSDLTDHDFFSASGRRLQSRMANSSRGRTLSSLNSYLSTNSKYTDDSDMSTDISITLPHLLPLIKFPKNKEKSQRTTILIKVWLMIAGFYRRAGMLEDCKGAVAEAQKLVQTLESEMAKEPTSGSGSTRGPAWGEKKSIDELWGDIYSELGLLALAKETPYTARTDFESALTYYPDHPAAIVGLSNILLDIYSEKLLPTPAIPSLDGHEVFDDVRPAKSDSSSSALKTLPYTPLGLVSDVYTTETHSSEGDEKETTKAAGSGSDSRDEDELPAPYKAFHLPLVDRLAARDRAFTLLSGLTRLGTGWDYSDAWFALARAHEENGQIEKAREVLWWCVELEEAMGVRDWRCLAAGGYII